METLKFLKSHKGDVSALTKFYGIKVKEYDDRYVLNYCQINSSKHKTHPIVRECRNLILSKNFEVLHRSFDRFFNYGEYGAPENFNILAAECYEKLDGSLIGIYKSFGKWVSCTRGLAFAEGTTSIGVTFSFIVERALQSKVDSYCNQYKFLNDYSYIFELVSPESRVVKPYTHTALYILAVRNKRTGEYDKKEMARVSKLPLILSPQKYTFATFEEILNAAKNLPSDFDEGYVCEFNGDRVKVKSPAYMAISKLRNNGILSIPRVVQLVFENETDEYISVFPEEKYIFDPYIKAHKKFLEDVQYIFDLYKDFDRKKFAATVKDLPYSGILFSMMDGKSLTEALEKLSMDCKIRVLESFIKKEKK